MDAIMARNQKSVVGQNKEVTLIWHPKKRGEVLNCGVSGNVEEIRLRVKNEQNEILFELKRRRNLFKGSICST